MSHVLAARCDSLGDVLLTGPALRAIRAHAGRLTLLCGPRGRAAAELLPAVDAVHVRHLPWIDADPEPVDPAATDELVTWARAQRFDAAVVFTSFHQSPLPLALLLRLAGVPWISAISADYPGSLLDVRHRVSDDVHEVQRALSLAEAAGFAPPPGDDLALRVRRPHGEPPVDGLYVVVHPGASVPARAWAPDRHRALVELLAARGRRVVVTGARDERALTAHVAGDQGLDLGGTRSFAELADVLADADAVVVANTGPAHLATAVGTPIVSVFAPTVPAVRWRPWAVPHELLHADVPCAGCRARSCPVPGHPCIDGIAPEEVALAVDRLAGAQAARTRDAPRRPGQRPRGAPSAGRVTRANTRKGTRPPGPAFPADGTSQPPRVSPPGRTPAKGTRPPGPAFPAMRIAMVSEHASPLAVLGGEDAGGQNVHVAALSTALARRGCEVVVHTRRDDPDLPRQVELAPGVVVDHVDAGPPAPVPKDELLPHMPAFAERLRDAWAAERPHVVHGHFWMSGLAALDAARPLGVPIVQTFHALGVVKRRHQGTKDTSPERRLELEAGVARRVDRILATCSDEVFELLRLGARRRRIGVVPCGVDLSRFMPDGPAAARTPGRRRIVCVSRFVERKGVGNVIEALADVPDAELLVAGGPAPEGLGACPEARRLRAIAVERGVTDRVRLLGRVDRDDLPALLRSADVVACVPWYEPFGIVPLEAMACGVPVVASAVGGLVDTVVDGVTGVHVPPRRPDRAAAALRRLLVDDERRRALGLAGARRARARYGWDRIAGSTLQAYEALAARRGVVLEARP